MIRNFTKGLFFGFLGFWGIYFLFMFFLNMLFWFLTDESDMYYQPIWNIFII